MDQRKFNYKTLTDLEKDLYQHKLELPLDTDLSRLKQAVSLGAKSLPNRLGIHPMEGCDAKEDGSPSELTFRRYKRYAAGGAGLIWLEATAVNEEGRGQIVQLYITKDNVDHFAELVRQIRETALQTQGAAPYIVLQITHSGRYGRNKVAAIHEPELDAKAGIDPDKPVISDEALAALEDDFVKGARLAAQAGFDAVDVKACHRYLVNELLGSHTRPGLYGGSYENRTRFMKNVIAKIKAAGLGVDIVSRLNVYDAIKYPYGWGTDENGDMDLTEPKRLVAELAEMGLAMINVSAATPYLLPHLSRPYDVPNLKGYPAPENPLAGVVRLLHLAKEIQQTIPEVPVVGTGFSWLRQFAPYVAAGIVKSGWVQVCGFGRGAFAYPDFAADIFTNNEMQAKKTCISCSKCSELKGTVRPTGCVVRDAKIYAPEYQDLLREFRRENR